MFPGNVEMLYPIKESIPSNLDEVVSNLQSWYEVGISLQTIIDHPWYALAPLIGFAYAHGLHVLRKDHKKSPCDESGLMCPAMMAFVTAVYGVSPIWMPFYWVYKVCEKVYKVCGPAVLGTGRWILGAKV